MNTYSFPILSYVYRLDHPVTGEFYIGYRCRNIKLGIPPELDIGIKYPTSSRYVKHRVKEFDITIVAEFFNVTDAYDHEQLLIHELWGNPKMLNKVCYHGKKRFDTAGTKRGPPSPETSAKRSASMMGLKRGPRPAETNLKQSIGMMGKNTAKWSVERVAERAGKRKFTNGTVNKFFRLGSEPVGWVIFNRKQLSS